MGIGDVATAPIDLTDDYPDLGAPRGRKRKAEPAETGQAKARVKRVSRAREYDQVETIDLTNHMKSVQDERLVQTIARNPNKAMVSVPYLPVAPKKSRLKQASAGDAAEKIGPLANADEEKRPRRYRDHAPLSYIEIKDRATSQKMFVINRVRGGDADCPTETLTIAGSTGNLYTIQINQTPSCNCPHGVKKNQCKHIVYAMVLVLKAPTRLQYQLGFLKSELRQIFAQAPEIPSHDATGAPLDKNRKSIDGDCPICFMPMEQDSDALVYCKAACGNNFHAECFNHWAASKRASAASVTCPLCRSRWEADATDTAKIKALSTSGTRNEEGYVNVASALGVSQQRDYSTYNPFWVRRQARAGVDVGNMDWDFPMTGRW